MKKVTMLLLLALYTSFSYARQPNQTDRLYLAFDFMKVTAAQLTDYLEVEEFWSKIHEQRVKRGDITGWDLWSLVPGGQSQGSQYVTVQLYSSFEKMIKGMTLEQIRADAKKAYPKMTAAEIEAMLQKTGKSREINNVAWVELIDQTKDEFDMPVGTICTMAIMKQLNDNYEKAESEIFKPWFQSLVDAGNMGSWGIGRVIFPEGSDRRASHVTFNMFKDAGQYAKYQEANWPENDFQTRQAVNAGLATRDMVEVKLATLLKKVR